MFYCRQNNMLIKIRLIRKSNLHGRRTKFTMSSFFQPFSVPFNQSQPSEEDSVSARLMNNYGVVRHAGPGTFHLLPLGLRAQDKLERINSGNNLDGSSPRKVLIEQLQRLLPADDSLPDQVRSRALVTDSSVHHLYFSPSLLYSTLTGSGYSHLLAQYHQ